MITSLDKTNVETESLTMDQAITALWEWRIYRNQVFWSSVYRWGAVILGLTIAPYLLPDLEAKLGLAVLVFPILAGALAIFASYLLIVLYMLYKLADRKYRALLGKYNPGDIPDTPINRVFRISIGKVLVGAFLVFGIVGQLLNGAILVSLAQGTLP